MAILINLRRGVCVFLVSFAFVFWPPSPPSVMSQEPKESPVAEIEKLLDERAQAVQQRNREAFLATVDGGSEHFTKAQMDWFDRGGQVGLEDYSLDVDEGAGDFSRAVNQERYGAPTFITGVRERYRISGYDQKPVLNDIAYTFVRREDGWRIASDADLEDLGILSARNMWEFDQVARVESEHFVALHHPTDAAFAAELLPAAEAAIQGVPKAWSRPWPEKLVIIVPSNPKELERMIAATFDVSNFVAFATASVDREGEGEWELVGSRIMVNPRNFQAYSTNSRVGIFAHELVHVATHSASGPHSARFLDEGLAELTGDRDVSHFMSRARKGFDRNLPEDYEFFSGTGADILSVYQESLSAVAYMEDRFGLAGVEKFYSSFGGARIEPGTSRYHLGRACQEALGISFSQFESDWADHIAARAG